MATFGRHLSFPFRIGQDGRCSTVSSLEEHVREELIQLLLTNMGERAFLPEFGGGLRRMVFEPLSDATAGMTKATLTQAISTWLGERITLEALTVEVDQSQIDIELKYRLAGEEDLKVMRFQRNGEIG